MVVVTLALFLPALMMAMRRVPLAAACAALIIILAVTLSQSASAKMAVIAGLFAYALFRAVPRRASLVLTGAVLLALLAIQPWQGRLIEQGFAATGKTDILFASAKERIVIWKATGAMALHALPWGTGMGSSDAVSETAFAKTMPPELAVGLRQTHAHDAFLNVLMELGLPGLIGMGLIIFGILRMAARLSDALFAPAMALLAQVVTVDLISHGAWQAWWFTAIMLGILALKNYAPAADQTA
jgi:O-antigen ligase